MKEIYLYSVLIFVVLSCKTYPVKTAYSNENIVLNTSISDTNFQIENEIKPYRDSLELSMNEILAISDQEMTIDIPQGDLGNFVTDITYTIGADNYEGTIDFALLNNGGLRTSLPKGNITRSKVFELMPFDNELVVLTLSAEKVKELFLFVVKMSDTTLSVKKGVPLSNQVFLEISSKEINKLTINGKPLENRTYKVITSDYLAGGGDNMVFFLNPIQVDKIGIKLRDAILSYVISENTEGRHLNVTKDKRITYAK